ncbi:MAG TPA: hypothetical protein PKK78_03465 [Kouleothrix sp.]|jgi:hypothetical protein|nr:hypothetical protein [Kouleothrix sp.]
MIDYATGRMQWLRTQLEDGWRLEGPVIERAVYLGPHDRVSAFEFMLRHERGCQVLAINDCPEVRNFLDERHLDCIAI